MRGSGYQSMQSIRVWRQRAAHRFVVPVLVLLGCAVMAPLAAQDGERWVTDSFEVTLRSGKSTKQSIVRMLPSGTRVELLETDADTGYSRVRTAGGAEGWILSRYLLAKPPARVTLPEVQQRLERLDAQRRETGQTNSDLQRERDELQARIAQLERSLASTEQDLAELRRLSANVVQVDEQNKQLGRRLAETEQLLQELRAENQALASRSNREWFIVGAGVLLGGMVLGLILPRIRWKRKSSWSDF